MTIKRTAMLAATILLSASATAQTAREKEGPSPYESLANEPAPKLTVDPPLPEPLKIGIFQAQYHVENLRIVSIFGEEARKVTPRVGHLHIIVDDNRWWWAEAAGNNTIDIANLAPGPHKVTVQLVDPNHNIFPGQERVINFVMPNYPDLRGSHHH